MMALVVSGIGGSWTGTRRLPGFVADSSGPTKPAPGNASYCW